MAQKTVYVKPENLQFFQRAEELSGDSISNILVDALKLFIEDIEMKKGGFEKQILEVGSQQREKDNLNKISFWGRFLNGFEDVTEENQFKRCEIYYTRKGKFLVYQVEYLIDKKYGSYKYNIYESLETIKETEGNVIFPIPESLIEKAKEMLMSNNIEFLDI